MKLLSLCSLLITQVFAAPVSQKEGSASLIQAINEIENSSNYKFTYLKTMMAFFSGYLDNFDFNKYPNLTMVLPTDAAFKGFSLSAFTDSSKVLNFVQCRLKLTRLCLEEPLRQFIIRGKPERPFNGLFRR